MSDWLDRCRAAVADVEAVLVELPTRAEREPVVRRGEGGDDTTEIDARAEQAVLRHFEDVSVVSEEVGQLRRDSPHLVVIDPIDGSLNAKRGIPFFSLSVAVADGGTMDDINFGFVHDFGSGEEWTARRGEGAFLVPRLPCLTPASRPPGLKDQPLTARSWRRRAVAASSSARVPSCSTTP